MCLIRGRLERRAEVHLTQDQAHRRSASLQRAPQDTTHKSICWFLLRISVEKVIKLCSETSHSITLIQNLYTIPNEPVPWERSTMTPNDIFLPFCFCLIKCIFCCDTLSFWGVSISVDIDFFSWTYFTHVASKSRKKLLGNNSQVMIDSWNSI